jgi:hypothetical protein
MLSGRARVAHDWWQIWEIRCAPEFFWSGRIICRKLLYANYLWKQPKLAEAEFPALSGALSATFFDPSPLDAHDSTLPLRAAADIHDSSVLIERQMEALISLKPVQRQVVVAARGREVVELVGRLRRPQPAP